MKVLYVLRSHGIFAYHESVIRQLCARGHSVEVLVDRKVSDGVFGKAAEACMATTENLSLDWLIRRDNGWGPLPLTRELLSYSSYLDRMHQDEFYLHRWGRYLPRKVQWFTKRSRVVRSLLAASWTQSLMRGLERIVPPKRQITQWLRDHRPDIVVASPGNQRFSQEIEYVKAAKSLGIPTAITVLSWDNLTTKGLIHVIPDLTLVWNKAQRDEAVDIHGVPANRIVITGAPFFDKWLASPQLEWDRETFCSRVGLDTGKAFVLYMGSSLNIARDESWLPIKLAESFRDSRDERLRQTVVLVRPHGAKHTDIYESVSATNLKVWFPDRPLPDNPEDFADFAASIKHSVGVVGLNTSGMVDALLADCPVIALLVKEYENTNAARAVHFRYLLDSDVYARAETTERCAEFISGLMDGRDPNAEKRHRFAAEWVWPRGLHRPAGEVAARAVELAALGQSANAIDADIDSVEVPVESGTA